MDGVATGDYVRFTQVKSKRRFRGYGTISNDKVAITKPKWVGVKASQATVIEHGHGYHIHYP